MLGATVTKPMLLGTFLIVTGTLCVVQFSSKDTFDLNTNHMKMLYCNPAYICYLCIMGAFIVLLDLIYRYCEQRKQMQTPVQYTEVIMPLVYSVWSALFGTQSVVQAKILAELLAIHASGEEDIFRSWFTYVTLILWLSTVAVWLKRLNSALGMFDPLFIIPLLQCSFIFFAIISGGIFFKEFNNFTRSQWIGFWCGVFVMLGGLILMTPSVNVNNKDELPKEVMEILMASGGVTECGRGEILVREPRTPMTTPRVSESNEHGLSDRMQEDVQENATKAIMSPSDTNASRLDTCQYEQNKRLEPDFEERLGNMLGKETMVEMVEKGIRRRERYSRSSGAFGECIMEVVKDVVKESARQTVITSKMLLSSHHGTAAFTKAIVSADKEKERDVIRREQVKRVCTILAESKLQGNMSASLIEVVEEMREDSSLIGEAYYDAIK